MNSPGSHDPGTLRSVHPRSIRIPAADGLTLHALEWSREGIALLLLHGFGNEAHIWDDIAPALAEHYRVLALDWRGHGDSDHDPEARYDYPNHLADLEAVCDALALDRVVLVGHSLGGRVATLFAGRHPGRMAGLAILDSGPELDLRGTLRIGLDMERDPEPSFASVAEYEAALAHAYPAAAESALRRMAEHGLRSRDDGRYAPKLDPAYREARGRLSPEAQRNREEELSRTLWSALESVSCPALVIRGAASDILSAEVADRMVGEALAQGTLRVVGQAGHSVMVDNPEACRTALEAFALGEE